MVQRNALAGIADCLRSEGRMHGLVSLQRGSCRTTRNWRPSPNFGEEGHAQLVFMSNIVLIMHTWYLTPVMGGCTGPMGVTLPSLALVGRVVHNDQKLSIRMHFSAHGVTKVGQILLWLQMHPTFIDRGLR